jgi:hypothetical protein
VLARLVADRQHAAFAILGDGADIGFFPFPQQESS